ncbi:MAG TPA: alpha/beta fold hydrolase [Chthonomonadaceae bacterium]|nr:alpha/beta fold hydrolase [Chthonomonadaceae bacterium]
MHVVRRLITLALAGLTLGLSLPLPAAHGQTNAPFTLPPPVDAAEALRLSYYAYDRALPLNAEIKPLDENAVRVRYRLDYDSVHDQRVPAILALPKRSAGPFPAVLLVHGSGGNKDTSYIRWASEMLTAQGYATLSIDTQYHGDRSRPGRSGEIHMPDSYTMRDAWVQSVVDLRRAVDYLETRSDIDKTRIGYLGFSQGAMLGAVLGGVEARVACFCLAVPGGGLVNIVKNIDRYPVLKAHWPIQVTPELLRTVEDIANVTDPIYFIGRIAPRPLLIIVAKEDEIIPPEASAALIAAAHAKEPEQVKRWESGHVLNPNALFDIRDFFAAHLGKAKT